MSSSPFSVGSETPLIGHNSSKEFVTVSCEASEQRVAEPVDSSGSAVPRASAARVLAVSRLAVRFFFLDLVCLGAGRVFRLVPEVVDLILYLFFVVLDFVLVHRERNRGLVVRVFRGHTEP